VLGRMSRENLILWYPISIPSLQPPSPSSVSHIPCPVLVRACARGNDGLALSFKLRVLQDFAFSLFGSKRVSTFVYAADELGSRFPFRVPSSQFPVLRPMSLLIRVRVRAQSLQASSFAGGSIQLTKAQRVRSVAKLISRSALQLSTSQFPHPTSLSCCCRRRCHRRRRCCCCRMVERGVLPQLQLQITGADADTSIRSISVVRWFDGSMAWQFGS